MDHQDWGPTVFKKRAPKSTSEAKSRGMKVTKERVINKNEAYKSNLNSRKVDNEEAEIKKIDHSLTKIIQKARFEAKMSQKELAQKLNLQTTVIQNYESGKVIPNKTLLYKMGKLLNTHLTGKHIGEPIKE